MQEVKLVDETPKGDASVFQEVIYGHVFTKKTQMPPDGLLFVRTSKHSATCLNLRGSYSDANTSCDLMQEVQILGRLTEIHFTREEYDDDDDDES